MIKFPDQKASFLQTLWGPGPLAADGRLRGKIIGEFQKPPFTLKIGKNKYLKHLEKKSIGLILTDKH